MSCTALESFKKFKADDPSRVDLNDLMKKVREEEKKSKRANVYFSAVAVSAIAVIGVVLTL